MDWDHVLAQSASCMRCLNGTKGAIFLMAAPPAGWSRMASITISPTSTEKNQTVPLCPKSQASAVQLVRGTLALGHCHLLQPLPAQQGQEEGLSIFLQGVSNLHALKKTFHISPPCTSAPVEVIFAKPQALPVQAFLAGILQLISCPLVSKPNFVLLPTCMAELNTGTHCGTWH